MKSARLFGSLNKWKNCEYILKDLYPGWRKDYLCAVEQEQKLEIALPNIKLLKKISGKVFWKVFWKMKTILENTNKGRYYEKHFTLPHHDQAKMTTAFNALIRSEKVVDCIQIRFDGDSKKSIIYAANFILNSHCWKLKAH